MMCAFVWICILCTFLAFCIVLSMLGIVRSLIDMYDIQNDILSFCPQEITGQKVSEEGQQLPVRNSNILG